MQKPTPSHPPKIHAIAKSLFGRPTARIHPLGVILFSILLAGGTSHAGPTQGGILGEKAPPILVDQWVSMPARTAAPTPASLKGKVVYLYCFQSWCPGCHSSGFPTLKKVSTYFQFDKSIQFIAVQTAFEGFNSNTEEQALSVAKKYHLTRMPIGHSGSKSKRPDIMSSFKTRGTPWTIIIGRDGIVKYNGFHIEPKAAIALINDLKKQPHSPTKE